MSSRSPRVSRNCWISASRGSVDVVLIDLELSRADGIDLVRLLSSECPTTKTLVLTSNPDWRVRPAMIAGAAGVLLKDSSPEAIQAAVVSVHLGDQVLCTEAAQWFLGEERPTHLTQRESDVLRMVAQGANNAEIATQLQLGQKTVRNYVSRLYRKLDLNNRAQLARILGPHRDCARLADGLSYRQRILGAQPVTEQPLNLRASLREIRRRRLLIIVVAALCGIAGLAYGVLAPAKSTAVALVLLPPTTPSNAGNSGNTGNTGAAVARNSIDTNALIAKSTPVLAAAGAKVSPPLGSIRGQETRDRDAAQWTDPADPGSGS